MSGLTMVTVGSATVACIGRNSDDYDLRPLKMGLQHAYFFSSSMHAVHLPSDFLMANGFASVMRPQEDIERADGARRTGRCRIVCNRLSTITIRLVRHRHESATKAWIHYRKMVRSRSAG